MSDSNDEIARLQAELRALNDRFEGFVANLAGVVWETFFQPDKTKHRVDYVSSGILALAGYSEEQWLTPNFWLDVVHPEDRERASTESNRIVEQGSGLVTYRWITNTGQTIWVMNRMQVIRDDAGNPIGLRGITLDITDIKRAGIERAEARVREEVLRAREESLLDISTPLMPIADDILVMTLVGALDQRRADRVLTTLLTGVTNTGASIVILDVTGVPSVDQQTADVLVHSAKAVGLLGAEVILTGIGPEVARTLVELGVQLGSIVTRGTLKDGIAYGMRARTGRRSKKNG